jgi:MYXO-CTERM domain-containing protein
VFFDLLDPDADDDGVLVPYDNCPNDPNPDQDDQDADGIGDACDACPADPLDADGDGVCDGVDVCPGFDDTLDFDGDGQADGCDCAPEDGAQTTDGVERCDGLDNNCDGVVDPPDSEGALPFHPDLDGDGFGDEQTVRLQCEAPLNFIAEAGDCDDNLPTIHPESPEVCDGVDNDCDGTVDPGCATLGGEEPKKGRWSCATGSPAGAGGAALLLLAAIARRRR